MLRLAITRLQLQRQPYANGIAYGAAFADRNEHDATAYQKATAMYSPASTSLRRRKWHVERQKAYAAKVKLMGTMARNDLGMTK
ncbi:unspecified product [Leishmania tarentolae]|uniref:Unspecified product n=1 Tax=Leishmania tarentolae TaxID=5689 RepID=A0A640KNS9_LEITA|nr:unspecified product [Leishmania tarentolae]